MSALWHYARDDQRFGPVTAAELKRLANAGELAADDLVWKDGMPEWVTADKLKGLFQPAPTPPTPRPAARPVAPVFPSLPPEDGSPFAGLGADPPPTAAISRVLPVPDEPVPVTTKSTFGGLKGAWGKLGAASGALQRPVTLRARTSRCPGGGRPA